MKVSYQAGITQTEDLYVPMKVAHRIIDSSLNVAEDQLASLRANISKLDLLEKRLDDLWTIAVVEGASLTNSVEKVRGSNRYISHFIRYFL